MPEQGTAPGHEHHTTPANGGAAGQKPANGSAAGHGVMAEGGGAAGRATGPVDGPVTTPATGPVDGPVTTPATGPATEPATGPAPVTGRLAVDGGTIAYEVAGAGPLIVLAHGMGDSRAAYRT
ncbi:hypothetical protein ADK38_36570, partial [Streptomyces varsoviensis]